MAGLSGLTSVGGGLFINSNDLLASLSGLENITSVGGRLSIRDNDALVDCVCGLTGLISGDPPVFTGVAGTVTITGNAFGGRCLSPEIVLASPCDPGGPPDESPPVCGVIDQAFNGPGEALSAITTIVSDFESGIASVRFTSLVNLRGYVDGAGPFSRNDTYTTPNPNPTRVAIHGERISYDTGGRIVVTVTNGVGLSSTCDPVVKELDGAVPEATALLGAYPNPARVGSADAVAVPFHLAEPGRVRLVVYDALGREVAVLADEELSGGAYKALLDARSLASGTYVVRMTAEGFVATQRLTVVK